jgi:hypothetical protein
VDETRQTTKEKVKGAVSKGLARVEVGKVEEAMAAKRKQGQAELVWMLRM